MGSPSFRSRISRTPPGEGNRRHKFAETLGAIDRLQKGLGRSPTRRELREALNVSSDSGTLGFRLRALTERGLLISGEATRGRGALDAPTDYRITDSGRRLLEQEPGTRLCLKCHLRLPESSFSTYNPTKGVGRHTSSWCKSCRATYQKTIQATLERQLHNKRRNAARRGIEFSLTVEDISALAASRFCQVCGVAMSVPTMDRRFGHDSMLTFDRRDNALGYISGNVWAICFQCNVTKSNHTPETWARCAAGLDRFFGRVTPASV